MKHFMQWLRPGLSIKRWMLLFSIGILVLVFGATLILNYQIFGILEEKMLLFAFQMTGSYSYTFLAICGTILVILGLWIMVTAVRKLMKRFVELLAPDQKEVSKQLLSKMELSRGPKVVAIGGGHGLSMLLRGLKNKTSNITAIVTVADDGGSSGRLREEMGIIAPGDLRNCLVALADKETVLEEIFQYRFGGEGELAGHSLGNLFLAALIKQFGSVQNALEAASKVLNIRGQVMPATSQTVRLKARMSDGEIVEGESEISAYPEKKGRDIRIVHMSTIPKAPMAVGDALKALRDADLITLGPGSLYTSVLPNLLVPEILQTIRESGAPVIYICNVMTQPGETSGYTVGDHLKALVDHIGGGVVDFVLANTGTPAADVLKKYEKAHAYPVSIDRKKVESLGASLIEADLLGPAREAVQDTNVLAEELMQIHNLLQAKIPPEALDEYLKRSH
ncbi:uridine diphosphate-N-acetylglucosamine-binding protein YvcK [uncultured Dialister sp.]|uniref:uridine diphosphate-N-acetylglucosamine-binding protein YvcK n=1 Tax=uncultured Dialister sp. TaxID=278064 RepID=UPI0025DA3815|nr:uridine diphosphate-N-acetylglucosamine-binding protein YvcK [uncultured Dialister sp.]